MYSVALYVEADRCAKELGIRYRGGFFENDDDYCQAVLDGAFHKVLQVRHWRMATDCIQGSSSKFWLAPGLRACMSGTAFQFQSVSA